MRWRFAVGVEDVGGEASSKAFSIAEFGAFLRLEWPRGACQLNRYALVAYWERFALILEQPVAMVVDADREEVMRFRITPARQFTRLEIAGADLRARTWGGVLIIPLADLEALEPGDHEVEVEQTFPLRRPEIRRVAIVEQVEQGIAVVWPQGSTAPLRLEAERYALTPGAEIVVGDELAPNHFAYVEGIGQPRRSIATQLVPERLALSATRAQPRDPAAGSRSTMPPLEDNQVALFAQIADDDDVARGVLIDLLADRGEPEAVTFALLHAGKPVPSTKRRTALGPLAHFFEVQFHRGLPAIATVVRHPPNDDQAITAMLGDLRLGLIVELRRANTPMPFYLRVLASPMLLALRRVDAPSHEALQILRERHAGQLTHLARVPLGNQIATAMLADAAFASVTHLELDAPRGNLEQAVATFVAAIPPLPGRHLRVPPQSYGLGLELARLLFGRFGELGLASLEVQGVTLARDGDRIVGPSSPGHIADLARAYVTP